jgi:hypothetical protein
LKLFKEEFSQSNFLNMYGSKWNKLDCILIGRGMGGYHGTMTCWLTSASTSFKNDFEHFQCLFNVCKSHKTTFRCNGNGWMCEGILVPWFSPPMLWWGGSNTPEPSNMFWKVLQLSISVLTLLPHCRAWSSEFNTYVIISLILLSTIVVVFWSINWVSLVVWSTSMGSSCDTSTMDTSFGVLACHLLGHDSTFDFGTFCTKIFGAHFLWSLL